MPDLDAADWPRCAFGHARIQSLARIQQQVGLRARGFRQGIARLLQAVEGSGRALGDALDPGGDVVGSYRLRIESRVPAAGRQGTMQLGGALPENSHKSKVTAVHVRRRLGACRRTAAQLEEAVQVTERVAPGVALILNVAL